MWLKFENFEVVAIYCCGESRDSPVVMVFDLRNDFAAWFWIVEFKVESLH